MRASRRQVGEQERARAYLDADHRLAALPRVPDADSLVHACACKHRLLCGAPLQVLNTGFMAGVRPTDLPAPALLHARIRAPIAHALTPNIRRPHVICWDPGCGTCDCGAGAGGGTQCTCCAEFAVLAGPCHARGDVPASASCCEAPWGISPHSLKQRLHFTHCDPCSAIRPCTPCRSFTGLHTLQALRGRGRAAQARTRAADHGSTSCSVQGHGARGKSCIDKQVAQHTTMGWPTGAVTLWCTQSAAMQGATP